jgi:hypothetical protein
MKAVKFVFNPEKITLTGKISDNVIAVIYNGYFRFNIDFKDANGELIDDAGSNDSEDITKWLKSYNAEFSDDSREDIEAYLKAAKIPEVKKPEPRKESFSFLLGANYLVSSEPKDGEYVIKVTALFAAGSVTVAKLKTAPKEETARIIALDYLESRG